MSQIEKRGIESNAIDGTKTRFSNNESFRVRDFANAADISLFKVTASDVWEFQVLPKFGASNIATESFVTTELANYIPSSQKGAASGVATLDGSGKVPVSQLPNSIMEYQGNWDASTNTPTLADGTGNAGDVYKASVAGTQNLGSGSLVFSVGDFAIYNGTIWEVSDNSDIANTDALTEGSTNLYFTDARAKTAAVVNSTAGSETNQAPSVAAMKSYVNAQSANVAGESFVLTGTDITNGYIDLAVEADVVISVVPKGFPTQHPVDDFTLSVVSLKTRITFAGTMLSLISGDKIRVSYSV
jgi:hypothetical protein